MEYNRYCREKINFARIYNLTTKAYPMPIIRSFKKQGPIILFDEKPNQEQSSYTEAHLDVLAEAEKSHFWFQCRRDFLIKAIESYTDRSDQILEIGGGTGYLASKLKEMGFSVAFGDIYLQALQYAQKKGIDRLYLFDMYHPPFSHEFHTVCLFDVLEHCENPLKALQSIKQMLRPKGIVFISVPAHNWLWSQHDTISGHFKRYNKKDLEHLFITAGFRPLKLCYFFTAITPLLFLRKWLDRKKENEFKTDISPFFNQICRWITRVEFRYHHVLPNVFGGSLLGIAEVFEGKSDEAFR